MYSYRCLKDVSYAEIRDCFNLAFCDYALPLQLTEEQLRSYLSRSGADKEVCYGAFSGNKMVGFLLNACGVYNGEAAVFDVGTGVIPEHRGNRVFTQLFRFAQQELETRGIKKYYLEVLRDNDRAIRAYEKQGFAAVREFCVLQLSASGEKTADPAIRQMALEQFDFAGADNCCLVRPSFEHCTNTLQKHPELYRVACKQKEGTTTAFCVFLKDSGHVAQLGYADMDELKELLQWLLAEFGHIILKNIDRSCAPVLEMLRSLGAVEVAGQFEMMKPLDSGC